LVVATLLTITFGAIQHQVRINHRIARDWAMAEDPCMFQAGCTDGAEDTASLNDGAAEEVRP
jgi:hypothetical protein